MQFIPREKDSKFEQFLTQLAVRGHPLASACETGSAELAYFAKASGMSTSEFQKYFAEDATGALTTFITGLGNLEDESAL